MPSETSLLVSLSVGIVLSFILFGTVLTLIWMVRAKRALERVVGLELLAGLSTALFVALSIWQNSSFFLEVALLIALIGFIATLSFARIARQEETQ